MGAAQGILKPAGHSQEHLCGTQQWLHRERDQQEYSRALATIIKRSAQGPLFLNTTVSSQSMLSTL